MKRLSSNTNYIDFIRITRERSVELARIGVLNSKGNGYAARMELTLSSPALLFPTISLLLLAYTNRFLTLASLIRALHKEYRDHCDEAALEQIRNLRFRLVLIRWMQVCGVASLLACTVCMLMIFFGWMPGAEGVFIISLVLMLLSLIFSLWEIHMSTQALDIVLSDLQDQAPPQ